MNELSKKDIYFASAEDWMIPIINEKKNFDWKLSVMRWYLPDDVEIPENTMKTFPILKEHIEFIINESNYKQFLTQRYIRDRITKSFSACLYEDEQPAAWGLTHDYGALGSLHVTAKYRRKNYGKEILLSLIHQCRELGKTPFAQIEETNAAAISLVKKLGFIQDRRVTWIKCFE